MIKSSCGHDFQNDFTGAWNLHEHFRENGGDSKIRSARHFLMLKGKNDSQIYIQDISGIPFISDYENDTMYHPISVRPSDAHIPHWDPLNLPICKIKIRWIGLC